MERPRRPGRGLERSRRWPSKAPPHYGAPATGKVENKGLKTNAIGYVSNIVIGVASTAPAYSLAATLGFIVADKGVGTHAPAVLLASFVPMLLISLGLPISEQGRPRLGHHLRVDDAAFGPTFGWLNGWAIFLADLLVMASLGYIAATYTFCCSNWHYGETHGGWRSSAASCGSG